ncbi:zinc finger protein [Colletotrichum truncatum]|uniref:Zinc finger protein n=1 Tax=Colletotrichum truncatum TaxID=5467 RepID=A0ACC3YJW3_COLTU|nr:zinc finger protein [Colletotrichum truncatum]KAF6797431.1 zinc finger protein [Colletotrichum truncatum]
MTFTCGTCWRQFPAGWHSREQHLNATGHGIPLYECDTCDRYFNSQHSVDQHMNALDHWAQPATPHTYWECDRCSDCFCDEEELQEHELEDHCYCKPCGRFFQNRNNLQQHLNSKLHRISDLQCPFCKEFRNTATGLVYHLEQGCCPNAPLDRDKLYQAVRQRDPNGVLAKKLLDWHGSPVYRATSKTWNPEYCAFECYLCHRLFQQLPGLTQHLNSPVHQEKLYHCPNRSCIKEFTTLAAVINHLESESCNFMRFANVQKQVGRIIDPGRMISF